MSALKRIVFVFGAGCSMQFGFPSGRELQQDIERICLPQIYNVEQSEELRVFRQYFDGRSIQAKEFLNARSTIARGITCFNSIDEFVKYHSGNEFVTTLCRILTAQIIRNNEMRFLGVGVNVPDYGRAIVDIRDTNQNWIHEFYLLLFGQNSDIDEIEFLKNVLIVNFNYDRTLEFLLNTRLSGRYSKDAEKKSKIINSLKIVHPYGMAGQIPAQSATVDTSLKELGYPDIRRTDPTSYYRNLNSASKNLMAYTDSEIPKISRDDRNFIENADCIVFLGFSYIRQNLEFLSCQTLTQKTIYINSFGLSLWDLNQIKLNIENSFRNEESNIMMNFRLTDLTAIEFIRKFGGTILRGQFEGPDFKQVIDARRASEHYK